MEGIEAKSRKELRKQRKAPEFEYRHAYQGETTWGEDAKEGKKEW